VRCQVDAHHHVSHQRARHKRHGDFEAAENDEFTVGGFNNDDDGAHLDYDYPYYQSISGSVEASSR